MPVFFSRTKVLPLYLGLRRRLMATKNKYSSPKSAKCSSRQIQTRRSHRFFLNERESFLRLPRRTTKNSGGRAQNCQRPVANSPRPKMGRQRPNKPKRPKSQKLSGFTSEQKMCVYVSKNQHRVQLSVDDLYST